MRANRVKIRVAIAGTALIALGLGVFLYKFRVMDLPLLPSQPQGLWQVGLEIQARSDEPDVSVRAALPEPSRNQLIFGEQFRSGRFRLSLVDEPTSGRTAIWRGTDAGTFSLGSQFRVQLTREHLPFPTRGASIPAPESLQRTWGGPDADFPSSDEAIQTTVEGFGELAPDDLPGRVRTAYAFVRHDIRGGRADDPLLVLQTREGSREGRERLLVTLLRGLGLPARLMRGLELDGRSAEERTWTEVWLGGDWRPMSVSQRFFGQLPAGYVKFGPSNEPVVSASGVSSIDYRYQAIHESLTPQEVATLMRPDSGVLAWLSLHRLPAGTQSALRLLLLMPVGALILTLLRNGVGVPSFGTFLPILLALAFRGTGLAMGMLLVGIVLAIGVFGRLLITNLRLLLVPRLSVLLCIVVLTMSLLGLVGLEYDQRDFFAGILFPIVILTMLIERFSLTAAEEGWREAFARFTSTVTISIVVYPVFWVGGLDLVLFSYPELILVIMGLLVWLGGYSGYRISDLIRFRPSKFETEAP